MDQTGVNRLISALKDLNETLQEIKEELHQIQVAIKQNP